MQLQHEFVMARVTNCVVKPQPEGRYRAYFDMLCELKKERIEHAE